MTQPLVKVYFCGKTEMPQSGIISMELLKSIFYTFFFRHCATFLFLIRVHAVLRLHGSLTM